MATNWDISKATTGANSSVIVNHTCVLGVASSLSRTITMDDTSNIKVGMSVKGSFVGYEYFDPPGNTVASITNSTTFELSLAPEHVIPSGGVSNQTLSFFYEDFDRSTYSSDDNFSIGRNSSRVGVSITFFIIIIGTALVVTDDTHNLSVGDVIRMEMDNPTYNEDVVVSEIITSYGFRYVTSKDDIGGFLGKFRLLDLNGAEHQWSAEALTMGSETSSLSWDSIEMSWDGCDFVWEGGDSSTWGIDGAISSDTSWAFDGTIVAGDSD